LKKVAIYFLNVKTFGRSGGSSAVSAAAYRAGERIRDERTGKTYDHTDRQDVLHKEIMLPGEFAADDMGWAQDRSNLWNTAESAESRKNARVAREYLVALPAELEHEGRLSLVRGFSRELVERYRFALDVAIHAPREFPGSDPRNFHAHLLATTREVTTEGLGPKTTLEWNDSTRREAGMGPGISELMHVRQNWADAANSALGTAHLNARVDHRTLAAQGIDREPTPHIPRAAFEMERHGFRSAVAERIREEYQARLDSRQQRSVQLQPASPTPAEPKSAEEARRQSVENWLRYRAAQPKLSAEELQEQSAERWLRHRQDNSKSQAQSQTQPHSQDREAARARDDDHSL
jgi:ATP-dependent exoDNAse (exonuclease V) alpha subunit